MMQSAIPVVRVTSSLAAERFYKSLGFEPHFVYRPDDSKSDPCYMGVARDNVRLHVSSFPGDGVSGTVVYVWVDDVDALYREFVEKGVATAGAPVNQTWGTREVGIRDIDGNSIRFGPTTLKRSQ